MIDSSAGGACPACGDTKFRSLFEATDRLYGTTSQSFLIVECSSCQLIRLSPWPSPGELKKYYPESYWFAPGATTASRLEEFYRRLVLRDHVNFVAAALKTQERGPVLDIGCGGALFGKLLRDRGYPCFGLDFSQTAATVGWSTNKVPVALGDFKLAPFREGSFGAVTMFHVLEHLYDPFDALSAVHKLLRPGGCLIVQVPNAACWQFLLFGEAWNGIDVPRHLVDFKARDLDTMLARSGFELVRHKYFSLRDNPAGLASTLAPGLDPMARRIRRPNEGPRSKLLRDLLYLGLVGVAVPFTLLEAACQAGSTVMVEARKKGA